MDIFEGLKTTDCLICLEPLVVGEEKEKSDVECTRLGCHATSSSCSSSSFVGTSLGSSFSPLVRTTTTPEAHTREEEREEGSTRRSRTSSRRSGGRKAPILATTLPTTMITRMVGRNSRREQNDTEGPSASRWPTTFSACSAASLPPYHRHGRSSTDVEQEDGVKESAPASQEEEGRMERRRRWGSFQESESAFSETAVTRRATEATKDQGAVVVYRDDLGASSATSSLSFSLSNVVALSCGHLFHYCCFTQLAEYSSTTASGCQCPVCRSPVKDHTHDVIRLRLRPRPVLVTSSMKMMGRQTLHIVEEDKKSEVPHLLQNNESEKKKEGEGEEQCKATSPWSSIVLGETPSSFECSDTQGMTSSCNATPRRVDSSEAEKEIGEDVIEEKGSLAVMSGCSARMKNRGDHGEVVLVRETHIRPAQAYCELLDRISHSTRERLERLRSRSTPLSERYEQLTEDVQELHHSTAAAQRRLHLLRGAGSSEQREELLCVAHDLKYMLDCCTTELATATRESQSLDAQIRLYRFKIDALARLQEK